MHVHVYTYSMALMWWAEGNFVGSVLSICLCMVSRDWTQVPRSPGPSFTKSPHQPLSLSLLYLLSPLIQCAVSIQGRPCLVNLPWKTPRDLEYRTNWSNSQFSKGDKISQDFTITMYTHIYMCIYIYVYMYFCTYLCCLHTYILCLNQLILLFITL